MICRKMRWAITTSSNTAFMLCSRCLPLGIFALGLEYIDEDAGAVGVEVFQGVREEDVQVID